MTATSLIWVVALAWLLSRQIRRRAIGRGRSGTRRSLPLVLAVLGAVELVAFDQHHRLGAAAVGILAGSFVVGAGLGAARGFTVRLWAENGRLFRQGTPLTILLWLVGVGLHLGSEHLIHRAGGPAGAGSASMLLYLGLGLTIQTRVLRHRARGTVIALRERQAAGVADEFSPPVPS